MSTTRAWRCEQCGSIQPAKAELAFRCPRCYFGPDNLPPYTEVYVCPVSHGYEIDGIGGFHLCIPAPEEAS